MRIDAPYYSQWLDVADADWQRRSCGICALKMAMRFSDAESNTSLDALIKHGIELGAYKPSVGWVHDGLVLLAKKYGFENSFRKEWHFDGSLPAGKAGPTSIMEGVEFIEAFIQKNIPVIASVKSESGGHLILLTGFEKEGAKLLGFYCNDPDAKDRESGKNKYIAIADFLDAWKGRVIVVAK